MLFNTIVADHYEGRINMAVIKRINMAISVVFDTFNEISIFSYPVSYPAHHGWAPRKLFKMKVLRWLENAIFRVRFLQLQCHRGVILLIFEAEFTESVFT